MPGSRPSWRPVAGLSRPPVLTAVLVAVTGALSVAGLLSPAVLAALERTPAALRGETWRWVTSLTVQDGGALGTASNLVFLALLGAAAQQVVGRFALVLCYLAAGLTGQVTAVFWQPIGAGNSVAICGLAGVLAWSLRKDRTPSWAGRAVALWLGALLATWWPPLFAVGVLGAAADRAVARSRPRGPGARGGGGERGGRRRPGRGRQHPRPRAGRRDAGRWRGGAPTRCREPHERHFRSNLLTESAVREHRG